MLDFTGMTVIVVDDEPNVRQVLSRLLTSEGFSVRAASSGAEALEALAASPADLVISDIRMPGMDGTQLLQEVLARHPDTGVVLVTGVTDVDTAVGCLRKGALDYMAKPFQVEEALARVHQALTKRHLMLENRDYQLNLETRVRQQAERIKELFIEGVQALAHALEAKDSYTRGHSARVAAYARRTGEAMGLAPEVLGELRLGAELHDVGKIGVRERVLFKPGRLTEQEYRHIQEHTVIGERILEPLFGGRRAVLEVVRSHHERPDGRGFPDGLKGDAIPLAARIVAVCDTFDAMTTARPYRIARPTTEAYTELNTYAGSQFDGDAVAAFLQAFPDPAELPIQVAPTEHSLDSAEAAAPGGS